MRRITLLAAVVLGSCLDLTQAGILEGFNENAPSLEELGETHAAIQQKNRRNKGSRRIQQENGGHLGLYQKGSKKSKSSGGDFDDSNFGDSDGPNNLIPGVLPEDGDSVVRDIDFMLVSRERQFDYDCITLLYSVDVLVWNPSIFC